MFESVVCLDHAATRRKSHFSFDWRDSKARQVTQPFFKCGTWDDHWGKLLNTWVTHFHLRAEGNTDQPPSLQMQGDPRTLCEAVLQNTTALQFASTRLRGHRGLVMQAPSASTWQCGDRLSRYHFAIFAGFTPAPPASKLPSLACRSQTFRSDQFEPA